MAEAATPDAGWMRQLYRWLYWLPRDGARYLRYGRPSYLIYFGGRGFGDDLLLGTVLHELRLRGVPRIAVVSRLKALFENSPSYEAFIQEDWRTLAAVRRFGGVAVKPN